MNTNHPAQENKMGVMPVNRLLLNMSIPIMISMLVQALYNVVDSWFVSKISQDALNAVSLAFPVQNLMISVGVGTAVGINALLSRSLGEKKQERANATAANGMFLAFLSGLVFLILGLSCCRLFFTVQTDVAAIVDYGQSYVAICCGCSVGLFVQVTYERLFQATGRTVYSMVTQALGAVTNIILDPIMIFGLFGFPRLEVAGAALATVTGQLVACLTSVYFNRTRNKEILLTFRGFRPDPYIIKSIYSVGVPSIIMSSIGSVMVFGMNKILISFTTTATAVFGVYFKLQSFVFMPVFGLNNGMVPIVAYNYGARKPERILKTVKLSACYAVGIMTLGLVIFRLFAPQLMALFQSEENMSENFISIGSVALRTISFSFPLAGYGIVAGCMFQALGHGFLSLTVSAVRQLVILLPTAFLLSRLHGLALVWWAFPIAELFAVALSTAFLIHVYRREVKPLFERLPEPHEEG